VSYSTHLYLLMTTLLSTPARRDGEAAPPAGGQSDLAEVIQGALDKIVELAEQFTSQPVSPAATHHFELRLQEALRELGRQVSQHAYNRLEPQDARDLAKHLRGYAGPYTRLNRKTAQNVWTLFGQVRLWRAGYRPSHQGPEAAIFPLADSLGLIHGASPALADRAARLLAGSGTSQRQVLKRLKEGHGVGWGVVKLRQVTQAVSGRLAGHTRQAQAQQLLGWLKAASEGTGRHKPVLAVGRDGITLPLRRKGGRLWEVASTATVSVLDRKGRRLGTVYLAHAPEPGQPTMSRELTALLGAVLSGWEGPLPRLCYVSDAGVTEEAYYEGVLRRYKHPGTGKGLEWVRVLDYYHASLRLFELGGLLFGKGSRAAWSWSRKMQRWLLKPGGANRVLHSAAAYQARRPLPAARWEEYRTAYAYLSSRIRYMDYAGCRRQGLPLGSGVTEAACKTVYTQRLKLSGMNWGKPGAQAVLNLRVVELSGVWEPTFQALLADYSEPTLWGSMTPTPENASLSP
jgi:hypothetical protein